MKIAITGSTSEIGKLLTEKLKAIGHITVPLGGRNSTLWSLGERFPQDLDVDVLIHLAHDRSYSISDNISAAAKLCASFEGKKIFLSTFSAHSNSQSRYGKSKYEIEKIFASFHGSSLRAGIVYGGNSGGIFLQLENLLRSSILIPMPYRGFPLLFATHIEDLIAEIVIMMGEVDSSTVFAANTHPISLRELLLQISTTVRAKQYFIPLPRQPFDTILRLTNRIIHNFQLTDSLLSLSNHPSYEELSKLQLPKTIFRPFKI
jgi:nucleoside-diphosphate-sugar epimerase